jgi:hypothetical protein
MGKKAIPQKLNGRQQAGSASSVGKTIAAARSNRLAHLDVCASGKRSTRYERGTTMTYVKVRIQNGIDTDTKVTERCKLVADGGGQ